MGRRKLLQSNELSAEEKTETLRMINDIRSQGALGNIQFGSSLTTTMLSTRMESMIWDDGLMDTAVSKAATCNLSINSDGDTLSTLYIQSSSRIPTVDPANVSVGEIVFDATDSASIMEAMSTALDGWRSQCLFLDYFSLGCDVSGSGTVQSCNNCRILLAETSRYIGCGFNDCPPGSMAVVCHTCMSIRV